MDRDDNSNSNRGSTSEHLPTRACPRFAPRYYRWALDTRCVGLVSVVAAETIVRGAPAGERLGERCHSLLGASTYLLLGRQSSEGQAQKYHLHPKCRGQETGQVATII